jgi:hypothetical protein
VGSLDVSQPDRPPRPVTRIPLYLLARPTSDIKADVPKGWGLHKPLGKLGILGILQNKTIDYNKVNKVK